jgi:hypothetical protein
MSNRKSSKGNNRWILRKFKQQKQNDERQHPPANEDVVFFEQGNIREEMSKKSEPPLAVKNGK